MGNSNAQFIKKAKKNYEKKTVTAEGAIVIE